MVGMNLNGVVQGRELKLVAQEIFKKAKSNQEAKADVTPKVISENPFSDNLVGFIPQETKVAKTGFEQNNVKMNKNVQQAVNSLAAIDRYGQISFRTNIANAKEQTPSSKEAAMANIDTASKDKEGKNPFAFFYNLPKNQEEALNDENIQSIFEVMTSKNNTKQN